MLSNAIAINLFIEAGICLLLPVAVIIIWCSKTKSRVSPFFVGALMFLVFAMGLEGLLNNFVLGGQTPVSAALNGNILYKAAYGGLAAGLFEETGRLVGFKWLMRKNSARETAITYGLGHGGIECMLVGGLNGLLYALVAFGTLTSATLGEQGYAAVTAALGVTAPATVWWGVLERVSAMILHVGLSILVFKAVTVKGKMWLYPVAILIHALVDGVMVYIASFITSTALIELFVLLSALIVFVIALNAYSKLPAKTETEPAAQA